MMSNQELPTKETITCPDCDAKQQNAMEEDLASKLLQRMTAAMREADRTFEKTGGSTRHHIRDCLLPVLAKHGLELRLL
jgi:ribosomal protein L44E